MRARLHHAVARAEDRSECGNPLVATAVVVIPELPHERNSSGRICDNSVHALGLHRGHALAAIAEKDMGGADHEATLPKSATRVSSRRFCASSWKFGILKP